MQVELVPVIELRYHNQGVKPPDEHPYWEYPDIWDRYSQQRFKKAGFKEPLTPYFPGSSFFRISDIAEENLLKIIVDHTAVFRSVEFDRDQVSALSGGYVLRIDGKDKFFPQCCGDLADIEYWSRLAEGHDSYYEGHPIPRVQFLNKFVILNLSVGEFDEPFQPTPPETRITIDRLELRRAVDSTKQFLNKFAAHLNDLNQAQNLNITDIADLLIWHNANFG